MSGFRMCKEILDDKTLNLEMMNNLNTPAPVPAMVTVTPEANGGPHRLPEKVSLYDRKMDVLTENVGN